MADTGIEWTQKVWNPVTGCTKVSAGCKNCYAERMSKRLAGRFGYPKDEPFAVTLHPDRLDQPLHWRKPRRIFVNSMSDLFHEAVPFEFIDKVFAVAALCPQHTFQILTKRPEWMAEYLLSRQVTGGCVFFDVAGFGEMTDRQCEQVCRGHHPWPLPNIWLGTSAEDQKTADERIPQLLKCPAAVRFISAEPLLGPIKLYGTEMLELGAAECVTRQEAGYPRSGCTSGNPFVVRRDMIHLVIVGCESGPGHRPCKIERVESIVEQCKAANVACFVKQVEIDGKVSHNTWEWLESIRVREMPDVTGDDDGR